VILSLLGGVSLVACDDSEDVAGNQMAGFVDVTAAEAFDLIEKNSGNPDFIILDVRTQKEFDEGYIQNAILINFYAETFRENLDKLDKNKIYLLYCRSGNRSGQTLEIMSQLGFSSVYHLMGGINSWREAGLPLVEAASDVSQVMIYV
jgi:rhodanese-related sulfurtransferase